MTTAHDKLPSIVTREADTDVDMDVARAQLRTCAESVGTLLPIASAKTLADAFNALNAERDALAAEYGTLSEMYRDAVDVIRDAIGGDFETLAEGAGRLAEICAAHRGERDDLHRKHEAVKVERDTYKAEADEAQRANDGLAESVARLARERDALAAKCDKFAEDLQKTSMELAETQALELNHQGACVRLKTERDRAQQQLLEAQASLRVLGGDLEAARRGRDALAAQLADMSENAAGAWCVLGKKACTPKCRCLVHAEADKSAADHAVAEAVSACIDATDRMGDDEHKYTLVHPETWDAVFDADANRRGR
jgi:chromosome segregation ATPase